jgi:hypothetical protein
VYVGKISLSLIERQRQAVYTKVLAIKEMLDEVRFLKRSADYKPKVGEMHPT